MNACPPDVVGKVSFRCLPLTVGTIALMLMAGWSCAGMTFAEALNATNAIWRTGGDAPWYVDTNSMQAGSPSIRSGVVTNGQESWIEAEFEGPALLDASGRGDISVLLSCDTSDAAGPSGFINLGDPWLFRSLSLYGTSNIVRWTHHGEGVTYLDGAAFTSDTNVAWTGGGIVINPGGTISAGYISLASISGTGTNSTINGGITVNPSAGSTITIGGTITNISIISGGIVVPIDGVFTGLFSTTNVVAPDTAGFFQIVQTPRFTYSGKIQLGRMTYLIHGKIVFDADTGKATNVIARAGMPPLRVEFQYDRVVVGRLVGQVTDGSWQADLRAEWSRPRFSVKRSPYAAKYTVAILGNPDDRFRAGYGYATLKLSGNGSAVYSMRLSDGTHFTGLTSVAENGAVPIYASSNWRFALVLGWLTAVDQPDRDLDGSLVWLRSVTPGNLSDNQFRATGSRFQFPGAGSTILAWTNGEISFVNTVSQESFTNAITLQRNGALVNQGPNRLALKLNKSNGTFNGTIVIPETQKPVPITGVILQKSQTGYGYFLVRDFSCPVNVAESAAP